MIYVSPPGPEDRPERFVQACEAHVRRCGWPHLATVVETTPDRPLELREGWGQVLNAAATREAEIVVVHSAPHLGVDADDLEPLKAHFRQREVILVVIN
jgi:DNA invertase Pin-like site-specific DNA recombinase